MSASPVEFRPWSAVELQAQIEAERTGQPFVVYRGHEGQQQIVPLPEDRDRITVGRRLASDVCLAWDEEVSRVHAELERVGDEWTLVDDGLSRNGSYLSGQRVTGRRRLSDGDVLRFGTTTMVFRASGGSRSRVTAVSQASVAGEAVTPTQRRVLIALARPVKGSLAFATPASNQQIAGELFLSVDAVKTHLRHLYERFGVAGLPPHQKRLRLVELALQSGIISEQQL